MLKNNTHVYNCIELDLRHMKKNEDFIVNVERQMAPIYTLEKYNGFMTSKNLIIINGYKDKISEGIKEEYDNIYFKDYILSGCKTITEVNNLYIISNKVTLI